TQTLPNGPRVRPSAHGSLLASFARRGPRPARRRAPSVPSMRFEGKVAIITGAAGGIGGATAARLASEGATVVINDVDEGRIAVRIQSLEGLPGKAVPGRADVTSEDEVNGLVERIVAEQGGVDILVNNAGGGLPGMRWSTVAESTLEEWNSFLALNLTGPFLCSRAVIPSMVARGRG